MILRPAVPADAGAMAALIRSHQHLMTLDPEGRGAEAFLQSVSEPAILAHLAAGNYHHLVAEDRGTLAGYIAVRDRCHLFHLFVARAWQGRGLARQLWSLARAHAQAHGNPGWFTVNASLNAQPVYERFGFRQSAPKVEANGVAFVPMRLEVGALPAEPARACEDRRINGTDADKEPKP